MKIVILDGYAAKQEDYDYDFLKEFGEVIYYPSSKQEEIISRLKDADIAITNKMVFDKVTLDQLPKLKMIQVAATGFNNVDLLTSKEKGIMVCNIPSYSTNSVAQLVFAYILNATNNVVDNNKSVMNQDWCNSKYFMYMPTSQIELEGKTLGIIGLGLIGKKVSLIANAFGMDVLVHSRSFKEGYNNVSLDELLSKSDFISIHTPLNEDTFKLVNKEFLCKMKKSAYLINTSRGGVIDEFALKEALDSNTISGAFLDVLSTEPPKKDNPLLNTKNIIITPHIAWATHEARGRLFKIMKDNISGFINNDTQNVVNK